MTEDIRRYELRKLKELVRKTQTEVHSILLRLGIWYYQPDLKRFLIWVQWSRRYHRSLKEIVERIVKEYQRRMKHESDGHLGLKISVLTGSKAEKFLEEEFKKEETQRQENPKDVLELKSIRDPNLYFKKVVEIRRRRGERSEEVGKPYRGSSRWRSPIPSEQEVQSLDRVLLEFDYYPALRKRQGTL